MDQSLLIGVAGLVGGLFIAWVVAFVRSKQARMETEAAKNVAERAGSSRRSRKLRRRALLV